MDIAQSLLSTLVKKADEQRITSHILEERTGELLALRQHVDGSKPIKTAPPGFELNGIHKALYLLVPNGGGKGFEEQAHWVKRLPGGQVAALPEEYTPNQKPYVTELYADPAISDEEDPVQPMPIWLHDALVGSAAAFAPIIQYAGTHLSWGVHAELCRYRQAQIDLASAECQLDSVKAQIRYCKEVQAGARGRMEMANVETALSNFRTIGHAYRGPPGIPRGRKFSRATNQGRTGVDWEDD